MILPGSYNYWLVALSVALAMFASYAALDLAGRVTAACGRSRLLWLAEGAISMGLGIWSMHYIGMLAFRLPVPVWYHYPTVIVSLLAAIAASAVALFTVSRDEMTLGSSIVSSLIMGSGIAAMHYIGMAAMRLSAMMEYRAGLVIFSLALAIAISWVALQLAFQVRHENKSTLRKYVSALVMGSAIPLMHYTGMWAATFRKSASPPGLTHSIGISALGVASISGVALIAMTTATVTAYLDRLLLAKRVEIAGARESELLFRTLAEAVPQITWVAYPDGTHEFFGTRWLDYSGQTLEESRGPSWRNAVHPDDISELDAKWKESSQTGNAFEIEYRFRRASDGAYRWFLGRANPIADEKGRITKWFGTCTDIEEQKNHQQTLEQQIKERTEELADANLRMHEEMWAKDAARRQLDEQNEKMVSELTERSQRATLLAKMGELLQSCISKDEIFSAALGFAPKIFPDRRGAMALLNASRSLLEVAGSWNDCLLPMKVFEPSACWALRTGRPHLVVAGDNTARCAHAAGVERTYLCVPILAQGEALGILHFQATPEAPTLRDIEIKTTFAAQLGLSVANIRLREALRTQSIKDPLTGLYNRRYLEEMLEREIRRAIRAGNPLGLLILDLDHFKSFNDTYGHDAGDTVLRETAAFLGRSIRIEDVACRFGGEEFVIILPTADLPTSQARAERIRSKLRDLAVLHEGNSLGRITVSVGVADLPTHGTSPKELLDAADAALYRAKREGRDRVVVAGPPVSAEMAAAAVAQSAKT